jgi:amidase
MSGADALLALPAVELRRRIGSKEISPVELLEACIARIEEINPAVNAITATCYDRARVEAHAAERAALRGEQLGQLHGLPIGIKDLEETAGVLTTFGSPRFRGPRAGARQRAGCAATRRRCDRRRQDQRA